MAAPVGNDPAKKSEGFQKQMSQGIDKGIHWGCETLQVGNWKSVALGLALVGFSLITMFYLYPHLMHLDFSNMSPSSIALLGFSGAAGALGLKGIISPATKNLKTSPEVSKAASIALAILIPAILIGYGASMMKASTIHSLPGANGCFWIGAIAAAGGVAVGIATIKNFWDQRNMVRYKAPLVRPADIARAYEMDRAARKNA